MSVVDMLAQAIDHVRPMLASGTTKAGVHTLWAAAKQARDLGAADVVHDAFVELAIEVGLIDARDYWVPDDVRKAVRRYGADDISHVISWAQRGVNPFERGALQ